MKLRRNTRSNVIARVTNFVSVVDLCELYDHVWFGRERSRSVQTLSGQKEHHAIKKRVNLIYPDDR